jgi:hypothetical protein
MAIQASALGVASLPRRRDRQLAANVINGDLHRRLLDRANYPEALYKEALALLVLFHSADPNIFYVYTMANLSDGLHFILNTATFPDLKTAHKLEALPYMEPFELRKEYEDDWLEQIASGKTYVTPTFEEDDYIRRSMTARAGIAVFVGIDFDLEYYVAQEAKFRDIVIGSLIAASVLALMVGRGRTLLLGHAGSHAVSVRELDA